MELVSVLSISFIPCRPSVSLSCSTPILTLPVAMPTQPFYASNLSFHGIPDDLADFHLEGSECCLIHADNPLSASKGVWLNPRVRVGYNSKAYETVHPPGVWISAFDVFKNCWKNRFLRWFTTTWFKTRTVWWRVREWQSRDPAKNVESGRVCLVNEMQVLVENGWAHV